MKDRVACVVRRALCAAGVCGLILPTVAELSPNLYKGRDALRVQFDGIDNQATGSHVSDATTWKSLVGSETLNIYTERANFADADNALTCIDRVRGIAAVAPKMWEKPGADLTIEAVFDAAKANATSVLWSPCIYSSGRHFYFSGSYLSFQSYTSWPTASGVLAHEA